MFQLEDYLTALFFLKKHTTRHVCRLDEPFVPEAIHSLPDGLVKWDETNPQIDQLLGGVFCPHQPALFVLLDSEVTAEFSKNCMTLLNYDGKHEVLRSGSPVDWEFRVQIGKFGGEVDQAFHGRQAQVASLRGWVLVQHHRRSRHISDVDPPRVDGVQLKLLAWYKFAPSENYLYLYHVFFF